MQKDNKQKIKYVFLKCISTSTQWSTTLGLGHFVSLFWTEQQKTAPSNCRSSTWIQAVTDALMVLDFVIGISLKGHFQVFNPIIISGVLCVYTDRIYIWVWSVGPDSGSLWIHEPDLSLSFLTVCLHHFWLSFCCAVCLWSHLGTRDSRRLLVRSQNIRSLPLPTGPSWWLRYVLNTFVFCRQHCHLTDQFLSLS